MATIMPEGELFRRAAVWICGERNEKEGKSLHACLDEAGMRFNLSPKEKRMLAELFVGNPAIHDAPDAKRPV